MENLLNGLRSLPIGIVVFRYLRATAPALTLFALLFTPVSHAEDAISVGFLNPTVQSTSRFYRVVDQILAATAQNLDIELHTAYGKNSSIRMRQAGLDLMKTVKPDYFLTGYYIDATDVHMDYAEQHPVKVFMITAAPPASEFKKAGLPRGKYKNWIGQLTPDDEGLGYIQADYLINMARRAGLTSDNRVNIIAFGGFNDDKVSDARIKGLQKRIEENGDAVLLKTTLAGWTRDLAYKYTLELLNENPSVHAIWSANDDMTVGCIKAAEEAGRKPGSDILIGGIDLNEEAIDYIESGKQAVSIGGQFMEAVWSLVMLYDYHHGIDFDPTGNYIFHSKAHVVTKQNAANFKKYFLSADWNNIDYRRFTKKHNPSIKEYDFSLEAFQKILMEQNG